MKLKRINKILALSLTITILGGTVASTTFANGNDIKSIEPSDPISIAMPRQFQSELTIKEISDIFHEYLSKNNINLKFGTPEYLEYLYEQMLYKSDEDLMNHPDYNIILSYFAEYIASYQKYELSDKTSDFTIDDIENKDKNLSEIRYENIKKDRIINSKSNVENRLSGYNATNAKNYAIKWWNSYNSNYNKYSADCTNFVSQCLEAGGAKEKKTSSIPSGVYENKNYWYSDKPKVSTPWIRVTDFHSYWAPKVPDANYAGDTTVSRNGQVGDVVQFRDAGTLTRWHTMIITKKSGGVVYLTGHTTNRKDYPISSYDDNSIDWSLLDF